MRKKYLSSPLPFQGQKRRFVKDVLRVVKDCPGDTVFVDLFGGSGLLSHAIKRSRPHSEVVYNDYDDFSLRLKNVENTNNLLAELRELVAGQPRKQRLPNLSRLRILDAVYYAEYTIGYVDYITLSSNVLFSGKYAANFEELEREKTFYNNIRTSDYDVNGYLDGLTVVKYDYRELYELFKDVPSVVFIVDPPYLSTDVTTYNSNYWKMKEYLDVLDVLQDSQYIYFTSGKSNIVELCEWMSSRPAYFNPFEGSTTQTNTNVVNWSSSYTDIMLHRVNYRENGD